MSKTNFHRFRLSSRFFSIKYKLFFKIKLKLKYQVNDINNMHNKKSQIYLIVDMIYKYQLYNTSYFSIFSSFYRFLPWRDYQ